MKKNYKFNIIFITVLLLTLNLTVTASFAVLPGEGVERHVFDSGLVVITQEIHDSPLICAQIWVRCGSIYETSEIRGISHYYEHMIFRGTNEVREGEINRTIEKWGGTVNALTSRDYTQYYFVVNKDYAIPSLKLLAEGVMNTAFGPSEVEVERKIVLEELYRTENNPQNYAWDMFCTALMDNNPYRWPVIGYEDIIKAINREHFIKHQKSYYLPNNTCVVLTGDFETEKILEEVKRIFSGFEVGQVPPLKVTLDKPMDKPRKVVKNLGMSQAILIFGYQGPGILESPEDIYAIDVLAFLLGQGQSSRLNRELKEEKNLVDGLEVSYLTTRYPSPFYVWAVLDKNNIDRVEEELKYQFKRLTEEPVTDEELQRAKVLLESTYIFGNETLDGLAGSYGFYEIVADDMDFSKTYVENLHKVTKEDIIRVAKKYFGESNYTIAILK